MKKLIAALLFAVATPVVAADLITFDSAIPLGYTVTGGYVTSGTVKSVNDSPNPDSGNYLVSQFGNSATISSLKGFQAISFDWGSNDTYNTLRFLDQAGGTINTVQGTGDGSKTTLFSYILDRTAYAVRFETTQPAFEVDNVSFTDRVPEPATWALMLIGFGMTGFAIRSNRTKVSFA